MSTSFAPVSDRKLLSKVVEAAIEEAIRSRKLSPGTRLPSERELCLQFNVSRTSLREALRMLSARGLLSISKGKGIFVRSPSAETVTDPLSLFLRLQSPRHYVLDVVHARQIIEPPIAASAAVHHTDADASRLRKDLQDLIDNDGNYETLSKLDMDFHLDIARASENPLIPLLLEPIHRLMPQIKSSVYATVSDAKQSAVEWHSRVLDAILARDPQRAQEAMLTHLKIAEEHAERMFKAQEIKERNP